MSENLIKPVEIDVSGTPLLAIVKQNGRVLRPCSKTRVLKIRGRVLAEV